VWKTVCGPLGWEPGACRAEVRRRSGISTGIFSQGLLTGLWDDAEWFEEVWAAGDAVFRAVRPLELGIALKHWNWETRGAGDIQLSFKADMLAPLWSLWRDAATFPVASTLSEDFSFAWAVSPADHLTTKWLLHVAGASRRCGDQTFDVPPDTCGFFKNEWVLRSPVHALCRDAAEFDYVSDWAATKFYVDVFRDLVARGLPGGVDACDPALYEGEPELVRKYPRPEGGTVYEYYARGVDPDAPPRPPVCEAGPPPRCASVSTILHVNTTDVAFDGTTESSADHNREVVETPGDCAALCPGLVDL